MDLLKIEGKTYLYTSYVPGFNQTWNAGTGRSSADGVWRGSILGFYTDLEFSIAFQNKEELSQFIKDTKKGRIMLDFYDPELMMNIKDYFYIGNYKVDIKGFYDGGSQQFYDKVDIKMTPIAPNKR